MSLAAVMMGEARVRAGGTRNGGEKYLSYRCALLKEFSKCAQGACSVPGAMLDAGDTKISFLSIRN